MNETLRQLNSRTSVRVFTDQPIADVDKAAILNAAFQAPTAGNQQLYTILDITDQELKEHLAVTCDHQPFIAHAPLVLVFCADMQKWYDAFDLAGTQPRRPAVGDLMLAVLDTAIAAQNAVVAAESLGIGSCYIGDILENLADVKPRLGLPDLVVPAVMLVFGYATQQQRERPKPSRFAAEHIVHENTYRRMDEAELRDMFAHRLGRHTFEEWQHLFCERKYNADFSVEMSRSTAEYVRLFTGE